MGRRVDAIYVDAKEGLTHRNKFRDEGQTIKRAIKK